jgi:hypothetical protein
MADVDWDKVAWDEPNEGGDEEVQAQARYQEKVRKAVDDPVSNPSRLVVGDYVRVKDGSFRGWHGLVTGIVKDSNQVLVKALPSPGGCLLAMKLEYWQVERVPTKERFKGWSPLKVKQFLEEHEGKIAADPATGLLAPLPDSVAWVHPTQSTPVEDIRKVEDGVAAFARWKEEEQEKVAAAMAHVVQQQTTALLAGQAEQRPLPEEVKKVVQWADRHGCLEDTVPGHAEWAQREGIFSEVAKSVQVTEEQVAALPLAEVHPANEGPYLLDEEGDVRTLKATAHPESLRIQVGNLEVVAEGRPAAAGIPFYGNCRILIDGKPFPVKSLVLRGNVDGLWTVELEFYPRQPKE